MKQALLRLLRLPLSLIPKNQVLPILSGVGRGIRWIVGAGPHGYWIGTYERDVQRRLSQLLKPGDHFVDVGANAGFYTMLAARLVGESGKVTAFEPLPRNLQYLRRIIELNRQANVTICDAAVSDQNGIAHFAAGDSASMGRLADDGVIEVRTVTLDFLYAADELAPATVVKIDIEGAEYRALLGAREYLMACNPTILLSGHGTAVQLKCEQLLREIGYDLHVERDGVVDGMYESIARWPTSATNTNGAT